MIARVWKSRWVTLGISIALLWLGHEQIEAGDQYGWVNTVVALVGIIIFSCRKVPS